MKTYQLFQETTNIDLKLFESDDLDDVEKFLKVVENFQPGSYHIVKVEIIYASVIRETEKKTLSELLVDF